MALELQKAGYTLVDQRKISVIEIKLCNLVNYKVSGHRCKPKCVNIWGRWTVAKFRIRPSCAYRLPHGRLEFGGHTSFINLKQTFGSFLETGVDEFKTDMLQILFVKPT